MSAELNKDDASDDDEVRVNVPRENYLVWARAHRYNTRHEPRLDEYRHEKCGQTVWECKTAIHIVLSAFFAVLRFKTVIVICFSVGMTLLAHFFNFYTDMPLALLSVGIIFPLSFAIQYSLTRRERALLDVASIKSSILSLYSLSRELAPKKENINIAFTQKMKDILDNLMTDMSKYISHHDEQDGSTIYTIYEQFDALLHLIEELRMTDDWLKSVISRAYQYHRYIMTDFERIRTVTDFRTPSSFRGYATVWLTFFPILFGPYFANIAHIYGLWAGLYASILCSLMLVTLSNINDDLEDPFDGNGVDDLNMEMLKEPILLFSRRLEKRKNRKRWFGQKLDAKSFDGGQGNAEKIPDEEMSDPLYKE